MIKKIGSKTKVLVALAAFAGILFGSAHQSIASNGNSCSQSSPQAGLCKGVFLVDLSFCESCAIKENAARLQTLPDFRNRDFFDKMVKNAFEGAQFQGNYRGYQEEPGFQKELEAYKPVFSAFQEAQKRVKDLDERRKSGRPVSGIEADSANQELKAAQQKLFAGSRKLDQVRASNSKPGFDS